MSWDIDLGVNVRDVKLDEVSDQIFAFFFIVVLTLLDDSSFLKVCDEIDQILEYSFIVSLLSIVIIIQCLLVFLLCNCVNDMIPS